MTVCQSARIWHGWKSSLSALMTGTPACAAISSSPDCAYVRHTIALVIRPSTVAVSAVDSPRPPCVTAESSTKGLPPRSAMPTLIVWGSNDHIIPVAQGHATHDAIAGSRLHVFDGAGHFPHCEHPVAFAEVVGEFMDATQPSTTSMTEWRARMRQASRAAL